MPGFDTYYYAQMLKFSNTIKPFVHRRHLRGRGQEKFCAKPQFFLTVVS